MDKTKSLLLTEEKLGGNAKKKDVKIKLSNHHQVCMCYILTEETQHIKPQMSGVETHYVSEENITLVAEPGSNYVGDFTPNSGKAKDISKVLLEFYSFYDLDLDSLNIIGCDSTNVNTGAKGGVIAAVEQSSERPLQWSVCILHLNELPLRHLRQYFDGVTLGPQSFSGDWQGPSIL